MTFVRIHPHPRSDVQNPRNSGLGLRAGLGDPEPYCDCSNSPSFVAESNWRVIIVSLQYLIMMCRTHCQEKGGGRIHFDRTSSVSPDCYKLTEEGGGGMGVVFGKVSLVPLEVQSN